MKDLTIIGIDIAKNHMQLHGATTTGKVVFKKRVTRGKFLQFMSTLPHCLIGMEACAGAHHLARELIALGFEVKLMSPAEVKKYRSGHQKNDAKDAQACAEAVSRASMKFVSIKSPEQAEIQSLHRMRTHYLRQHVGLMNMIRGLLLERGITIAKGKKALVQKLNQLLTPESSCLSIRMKEWLSHLYGDLKKLEEDIAYYTEQVKKLAQEDDTCRRLQSIEGIAEITATALIAKIGNASEFKRGRELSAYLGLVPKQHASGETCHLGSITKHGDRYIRQLLIHGGRATIRAARRKDRLTGEYKKQDQHSQWVRELTQRVGYNRAAVAIANKNARMAVALMKNQTSFQPQWAH